jgi:hypothetical protein
LQTPLMSDVRLHACSTMLNQRNQFTTDRVKWHHYMPTLLFEHHGPVLGATVLAWGWWGIIAGSVAWYANVALAIAVYFYWRGVPGRSLSCILVALALGVTSHWAKEWWFSEASGTRIVGLGIGYAIWFASMVIFAIAVVLSFFTFTSKRRSA